MPYKFYKDEILIDTVKATSKLVTNLMPATTYKFYVTESDKVMSHKHVAYSWSADGRDRFTISYPNENLLLNSQGNTVTGYTVWNSSQLLDSEGIKVSNTQTVKGSYGVQTNPVDLTRGETYTLQAMLGSYYNTRNFDYIFLIGVDGLSNQSLPNIAINANDAVLRKYNLKFIPNVTGKFYVLFGVDTRNEINKDSNGFRIREIKLEKNTNHTIYTPSPKDNLENAYPKYIGIHYSDDSVQSVNSNDYTWTKLGDEQNDTIETNNEDESGKSNVIEITTNSRIEIPTTNKVSKIKYSIDCLGVEADGFGNSTTFGGTTPVEVPILGTYESGDKRIIEVAADYDMNNQAAILIEKNKYLIIDGNKSIEIIVR